MINRSLVGRGTRPFLYFRERNDFSNLRMADVAESTKSLPTNLLRVYQPPPFFFCVSSSLEPTAQVV